MALENLFKDKYVLHLIYSGGNIDNGELYSDVTTAVDAYKKLIDLIRFAVNSPEAFTDKEESKLAKTIKDEIAKYSDMQDGYSEITVFLGKELFPPNIRILTYFKNCDEEISINLEIFESSEIPHRRFYLSDLKTLFKEKTYGDKPYFQMDVSIDWGKL